ncbi:unnamed protein product [Protopolystoma xenopodis]|uniref:Uncharacterized protein n=1 Tax=Protopolystoma xenopodis TaxID=117903 RepID=A0A3S5CK91_9PLAT|nr:unnamed protein product [Protopolystoma xenopodis]
MCTHLEVCCAHRHMPSCLGSGAARVRLTGCSAAGSAGGGIDAELLADLEETFPTLYQGWLPRCELRQALEKTGFNLPGHEFRELEKELPNFPDGKVPLEAFVMIYSKVKEAKDVSRLFRKENILRERPELRVRQISTIK